MKNLLFILGLLSIGLFALVVRSADAECCGLTASAAVEEEDPAKEMPPNKI